MKKAFVISAVCTLLFLFMTGSALAQITDTCDRTLAQRLDTARALVTLERNNYASRINYWGTDITYKEPVLTNQGRQEMLDYLAGMFNGTPYGFPNDRAVTIMDELTGTNAEGDWVYGATIEWTGTFNHQFFFQRGISILKFRAGEGCPYYHRDYFSEGDSWWNVPIWQPDIRSFRNIYILIIGLTERCFDEDGDGFKKYELSLGCPNSGLDCNDFVAEINRGAEESTAAGNCNDSIDNDCDGLIDGADPGCS